MWYYKDVFLLHEIVYFVVEETGWISSLSTTRRSCNTDCTQTPPGWRYNLKWPKWSGCAPGQSIMWVWPSLKGR